MKRNLAIATIIFIVTLIIISFILSIFPQYFNLFIGVFMASVIVPFMIFGIFIVTKMIKKDKENKK